MKKWLIFFCLLISATSYAHSPFGRQGEPKTKYKKAVAPTVDEDVADGFIPGSLWIDTVGNAEYVCVDNTSGAAVWKKSSVDDHGDLGGITDDDHQLYILTSGNRAFTGNQSHGDNNIYSVAELHFSTNQVYFKKIGDNQLRLYVGGSLFETWIKEADYFLLKEDGGFLLKEDGGRLILE